MKLQIFFRRQCWQLSAAQNVVWITTIYFTGGVVRGGGFEYIANKNKILGKQLK